MRWLVDAMIAFSLLILGCAVAGLLTPHLQFLDPLAYPAALVLAWFPVAMWIGYCHVGPHFGYSSILLLLAAMGLMAAHRGLAGFLMLPFAFMFVLALLPVELLIGKIMLGMLPGSHNQPKAGPSHATDSAVGPNTNGESSPPTR